MQYGETIFQDRWRVAGVPLLPLCLGHALLLQRFRSPFATPDPRVMIAAGHGDVALALAVCGRHWKQTVRNERSGRLQWLQRWYSLKVSSLRLVTTAASGLMDYIADAWQPPKVWIKDNAVQGGGIDDLVSPLLDAVSLRRPGISDEDLFSYPVRRALVDRFEQLRQAGVIEFRSAQDEAMLEAARKEKP